jgi:hypothetical protein
LFVWVRSGVLACCLVGEPGPSDPLINRLRFAPRSSQPKSVSRLQRGSGSNSDSAKHPRTPAAVPYPTLPAAARANSWSSAAAARAWRARRASCIPFPHLSGSSVLPPPLCSSALSHPRKKKVRYGKPHIPTSQTLIPTSSISVRDRFRNLRFRI